MTQQRALSLVDKLNQNNVQERLKSIFINKEKTGPWVIELDPTTACNLACHDCISANLLNQGGIDSERILKLADEFKEVGVRAVVLIGGGEPMAHKEFGRLVESFASKDIHVGVTTNGTLMKKYIDTCANSVSWLRVSVDAGSSEVFQEVSSSRKWKISIRSCYFKYEIISGEEKRNIRLFFFIIIKI